MLRYDLSHHLRFCHVGEDRVLLDLVRDRYFRLPPLLDRALDALLEEKEPQQDGLEALLAAGLLVPQGAGRPLAPTSLAAPQESLVEGPPPAPPVRIDPLTFLECWHLVRRMRRAVASRRIQPLIASSAPGRVSRSALMRDGAARRFLAARQLVPAPPSCLSDSLALHRFLRRRGVRTDLVIAVKLHPFGAHSWVQDGDLVLNDAVGTARTFTPILVA